MSNSEVPIPEIVAMKICRDIREQNRTRRLSFAKVQCWGCQIASKTDARKMCLHSQPGNRGCALVTKVFDQQFAEKDSFNGGSP